MRSYSQLHGMMHRLALPDRLAAAAASASGSAYHIAVQIEAGQIDHTPALYVIDPQGRLARLYMTQKSYASVGQQAQILAREASSLLPGHPAVHSNLSYDADPDDQPRPAHAAAAGRGRNGRARARGPRGCCCSSPPGIRR